MTDFYIDDVQSLEAFRMRFDACLTQKSLLNTYMMSACPIPSWLSKNFAFLQPTFSLKKRLLAYSNIFGVLTFQQTIQSIDKNYILPANLCVCGVIYICVCVCVYYIYIHIYIYIYIYRERERERERERVLFV